MALESPAHLLARLYTEAKGRTTADLQADLDAETDPARRDQLAAVLTMRATL